MANKSIETRGCGLAPDDPRIPRRGIAYSELSRVIQNNRASNGLPPQTPQEHIAEVLKTGHYKVWARVVDAIVGTGC
ncbi:hypothetical protein HY383_04045 [Candidatus Daviesbacteria bacterium]|nr:hypothetical protein [Candidatus Daviesbacteria bacterium]